MTEHQNAGQPDAHLDRLLIPADLQEPLYKSMVRRMREVFNPPKLPPLEITSIPIEGAEMGGVSAVEVPWYKSLVSNVRDLIRPPKLPPLEVTSKPVEVKSIWGAYRGGETRTGAVSLLIHVGIVALALIIYQVPAVKKKMKDVTDIYFPIQPYKPKLPPASEQMHGGGGGGNKMPKPVSRGEAPKFAPKQMMPPMAAVPKPVLPVVPTITAPAPQIVADNYGDPLAKNPLFSTGPGTGGFGTGSGGGIGSGNGNGYGPGSGGGTGGGVFRPGGDVSMPQLVSKVEPEYSEEARKAKYSGTVLLQIIVDEHGLPRDIKVVRPVGLGLDEKAVEAVSRWRFRPGYKGGRPVAVEANIEVSFRLL
ncbi:MAG: energy transducer TonB [Acidobacteriaceae bacterium]|nr:energy transducer TonB [Acidobacteriaceae bacterium]MBV9780420.1 energy transducer TonB [Acidobacteriaceae bacterium]